MDQGEISFLLGRFIIETLILSSPILIVAIVVGLIVAIFQATTSVQEQTISFAPKLFAIFLVLIIGGGWMLTRLKEFTIYILSSLAK